MFKQFKILAGLLTGLCFAMSVTADAQSSQSRNRDDQKVKKVKQKGDPLAHSRYAGETSLLNGVDLELHSEVTVDNNVFNRNNNRHGDLIFQEGASFSLLRRRQTWDIWLDYRPDYVFFRQSSAINQFNQEFGIDTDYRPTRHVTLRLKDSLAYEMGVLVPRLNADFNLPIGPPAALNTTIFTPTARAFSNQVGFDTAVEVSRRTSFEITTGYGFRRFSRLGPTVADFLNTKGYTGGFGLQYRVTERLTIGPRFLYQNYRFGSFATDKTESAFINVAYESGPGLSFSAFGGPQYSDANGQFLRASNDPSKPSIILVPGSHKGWNIAGGGAVNLRSEKTLLRFSAQRMVSDGGGLLTAVSNTSEAVELRRRLNRYWDVVFTAVNARSLSLQSSTGRGQVDGQSFGVAVERPITENWSVHGDFNYLRQRTNQVVPFEANIDRNRVMVGVFYRIGTYKLGQ